MANLGAFVITTIKRKSTKIAGLPFNTVGITRFNERIITLYKICFGNMSYTYIFVYEFPYRYKAGYTVLT